MPIEHELFKCSNKECLILSLSFGLLLIVIIFILNIYFYKYLLEKSKKYLNIQETFNNKIR